MGNCFKQNNSQVKPLAPQETKAFSPSWIEQAEFEEDFCDPFTILLSTASTKEFQTIRRQYDEKVTSLWRYYMSQNDKIKASKVIYEKSKQHNGTNIEKSGTTRDEIPINQLVIGGQPCHLCQLCSDDKDTFCTEENIDTETLHTKGIGYICKKGQKMSPRTPNQDDFSIMIDGNLVILGVFDGHGQYGHEVSNFIRTYIPSSLYMSQGISKVQMIDAFTKAHRALVNLWESNCSTFDCLLSGSTATVASIFNNQKLIIGHVGDSRAVIGRSTETGVEPVVLTADHKFSTPEEKARAIEQGGQIRKQLFDTQQRIFVQGKTFPGLNMSRSIGDLIANNIGVSNLPDVKQYDIFPSDLFVVIWSDGVWEFMTDVEVVNTIYSFGRNRVTQAVESLGKKALTRWQSHGHGVVDDITAILYYFKD